MLHQIPTLHFRGIVHQEIVEKYFSGRYLEVGLPQKRNIHLLSDTRRSGDAISRFSVSGDYFIITSNTSLCEEFISTGMFSPKGGRCACGIDFAYQGVGIPIGLKKAKGHTFLFVDGLYHAFNCALRAARSNRSFLYKNSEQYIRFVHSVMYPDKELNISPDFSLFKKNGGSLKNESFSFDTWIDEEVTLADVENGEKSSRFPIQIPVGIQYRISGDNYVRLNSFSLPNVDSSLLNDFGSGNMGL